MLGVFPSLGEIYEVIVCNGTVWQPTVLFVEKNHERRNVYVTD